MTDPVYSVITLLAIGLTGTLWWIYSIMKLAHTEKDAHLQNQENQENS